MPQLAPLYWLVHVVFFYLVLFLVIVSIYYLREKPIKFRPFSKEVNNNNN